LGREAYNLPPTGAKNKHVWSYTSTLPYDFMARCLIKQGGSMTFT